MCRIRWTRLAGAGAGHAVRQNESRVSRRGTNQRSNPALPYAPETVTDYEIGAKSDWFERRLRVNLDAYHSDYKNIQRSCL